MKKYIMLLVILFSIVSCNKHNYNNQELEMMVNSDDIDSIVLAIEIIKKDHNVELVPSILKQPYDPRITHKKDYYGKSVYQIKILAVKDLTNIPSPYKITYQPDSQVVNFYLKAIANARLM